MVRPKVGGDLPGPSQPPILRVVRVATRAEPLPGPGPFRYHLLRLCLKGILSAYVRIRVVGTERLPASGGYILCFNHPSWLDPPVLAASWPDQQRRLYIFGPKERDMTQGFRNHLINWTQRGVPLKPDGSDVLDVTRHAMNVLRGGDILAVAGEGRLSDSETHARAMEPGVAHFAMMAGVPVVPVGLVGTRWVHFGGHIRVKIGEPLHPQDFPRGKQGALELLDRVQAEMPALLAGEPESEPVGRFGRWFSEAFNDRPWEDHR